MNPTVDRLEALLARVQHNRKLPRAAASVGPVVAAVPEPRVAAPAAPPLPVVELASEPVAIRPNGQLDAPPSLDEVVDDAVIVAESKTSPKIAALPDLPVLELEPHAPKAPREPSRPSIDDLDDPGIEPLPEPDPFFDEALAETKTEPVAAAPIVAKRTGSESQLAAAVQVAADEEPRTEPPARSPVLAKAPEAPAPAAPAAQTAQAGIQPVAVVPAPFAAASGPIVKVVVAQPAPKGPSYGELVALSLSLRPR